MSGFFRGTSYEQDSRWNNKQEKLKKSLKFPAIFKKKVDLAKVKLPAIRAWVNQRLLELLGTEDDILPGMVMNMLELGKQSETSMDPRDLQINITGFLGAKAKVFMEELWELLVEASRSPLGIPPRLLEAEKQQIEQQTAAQQKLEEELRRVREQIQQRQYGLQLPKAAPLVPVPIPAAPPALVVPSPQQPFFTATAAALAQPPGVKAEPAANGSRFHQPGAADRDYSPEPRGRGETSRSSYSPSPRRSSRYSRSRSRSRSHGRRRHRDRRDDDYRSSRRRRSSSRSRSTGRRRRRSRSRSRSRSRESGRRKDRRRSRSRDDKNSSSSSSSGWSSRRRSRSRSPRPKHAEAKKHEPKEPQVSDDGPKVKLEVDGQQ